MANLTVRNIPDRDYALLRRDAERNHRSLNAELLATISEKADMSRRRARAVKAMRRIDVLRQEIAREYPNQPDSVDLIREDRDSH